MLNEKTCWAYPLICERPGIGRTIHMNEKGVIDDSRDFSVPLPQWNSPSYSICQRFNSHAGAERFSLLAHWVFCRFGGQYVYGLRTGANVLAAQRDIGL